jgi:hypothetical protein
MSVAPLIALEAAFLRRQMPDLLLRPGMTLAARVSDREGRHGVIVLAGHPLVAELPDGVSAGDKLRLLVEDTRGDRVVMRLVQEQPTAPAPPPTVALPLPDGSQVRLTVDEEHAGEGTDGEDAENASIALTYESPALGAVALFMSLAPGSVNVRAELPAGRPFELADDAASELRSRLAEVLPGRVAEVTVVARREPLDVYA